jgi:hypothetical protein
MAASSGFYQSPEPPQLGNAQGIVLAHRRDHQKWPAKFVHFLVVVLFAVALVAAGAIWSK